MVDERDRGQRRVYVLPTELVARVTAFQTKMGLPSEVEAVRRLLDEGLKHREDAVHIISRFAQMMKETKVMSDIVREVLVGHPKVTSISFEAMSVKFTTSDGDTVTVYNGGGGKYRRGTGDPVNFDKEGELDEIPF